ncbi:MAG: hypothetical protein ACON5B_17165 [Myxococcota bacterium]
MKTRDLMWMLLLAGGCSMATLQVNANVPNAVAYLVDVEPSVEAKPTQYISKTAVPATLNLKGGKHWLYVTAPQHEAKVVLLKGLSKKQETKITVELTSDERMDSLK